MQEEIALNSFLLKAYSISRYTFSGTQGTRKAFFLGFRRFNPRPRAGGDIKHIPLFHVAGSFNPRPRAGGDTGSGAADKGQMMFQSTPPRGGRRDSDFTHSFLWRFNPRPRAGGDFLTMRL